MKNRLNRSLPKIKYLLLALVNILFIVLSYGKPVEIKGTLSPLLWLFALCVTSFSVKNGKKALRALFVLQLTAYLLASGIFFLREYTGRRVISSEREGNIRTVVYQLDPGAVGHTTVQRREYYCIVDGELLSVGVLLSQDTKRGSLMP
ncbi:MAG: hypothetical protein K2N38_13060 [Oscillospiraceae bacterium]|nr:hypothetical protein [Oscillospiraceae bacterium]